MNTVEGTATKARLLSPPLEIQEHEDTIKQTGALRASQALLTVGSKLSLIAFGIGLRVATFLIYRKA
jgi:hypothetical protein